MDKRGRWRRGEIVWVEMPDYGVENFMGGTFKWGFSGVCLKLIKILDIL